MLVFGGRKGQARPDLCFCHMFAHRSAGDWTRRRRKAQCLLGEVTKATGRLTFVFLDWNSSQFPEKSPLPSPPCRLVLLRGNLMGLNKPLRSSFTSEYPKPRLSLVTLEGDGRNKMIAVR